MRLLVVGATGLVGSHLLRALGPLGDVRGTFSTAPAAGLHPLDLRDRAAVEAHVRAVKPEVILCAAAIAWAETCEREPNRTRAVNVVGVANLVDAARAIGAIFVYFSSDYVFDGSAGPYAEDDHVAPINEYGRQKVAAEGLVRGAKRFLICRTSGVFGQEARRKNFVYQVIDRLRDGRIMEAADDQIICPTWAVELAEAVHDLLAARARGVVHVVAPEPLTRAAFAHTVARAFGLDERLVRGVPTAQLGLAAPRPHNTALRDERLRELIGRRLSRPEVALAKLRASLELTH